MLIIFASTLITSILLFSQLGNYLVKNQRGELSEAAEHISEMTAHIMFDEDETTKWMFKKYIDNQARNSGSSIMIINSSGETAITDSNDYV